jgi:hypothetical protein
MSQYLRLQIADENKKNAKLWKVLTEFKLLLISCETNFCFLCPPQILENFYIARRQTSSFYSVFVSYI